MKLGGHPLELGIGRNQGRGMKIGILSDTHDRVARTVKALQLLLAEGAEAIVHCGDLTRPEIVRIFAKVPTYFVFGNNDYDHDGLLRAMVRPNAISLGRGGEIELAGKRIVVIHGDSAREVRRLASLAPDYLLYGHSHITADERIGPTRWINPGALHRAPSWTVALLDLNTDELRNLTIADAT